MKKEKILKILFIISLVPFIYLILCGIFAMGGIGFFGSNIYGFDAFLPTVLVKIFQYFPIFLICFGYLLFYLVYKILYKNKDEKKNSKTSIILLVVIIILILLFLLFSTFSIKIN